MNIVLSYLPLTAAVALGIFILKEIIEAYRRIRADKRKISGYKLILARECERNNAALKGIRQAVSRIKEKEKFPNYNMYLDTTPAGHLRFHASHSESGSFSIIVRPPQLETMGRIMIEMATIDRRLFSSIESAYDAVSELKHLRDSLIDILSDDVDEAIVLGFPQYAEKEMEDIFDRLEGLYKVCTGSPLEKLRLR